MYTGARFGAGAGPIVMDDVRCTSTESRLIDCPSTFNHNCVHSEDAGVRCISSSTGVLCYSVIMHLFLQAVYLYYLQSCL